MGGTSMYSASILDKTKNVAISLLELRETAASDGYWFSTVCMYCSTLTRIGARNVVQIAMNHFR